VGPVWSQAAAYLQLALSIDRHLPGFVDAFFGPAEHPRAVRARGKTPLDELSAVAASLRASVASDEALERDRRTFLTGQLEAMSAVLEILAGQPLPIGEETRRLYRIDPKWTDEATFLDAHQALEEIVPGGGPLANRCQEFERRMEVPPSLLQKVFREVANDLKSRSVSRLPLPPGDKCEFRLVRGKPWYAYNHYRGNFTSRIEINVDVPMNILWLPSTLAHEAYPGHHAESAIKEERLVRGLSRLEHSVQIENSPASVISEGIANTALSVLTSREERVEIYAALLRRCGLSAGEGERAEAYMQAQRPLRWVRPNCILLAHRDHLPEAELIAYSKRYGLIPENEARMILSYIRDPLRRSYGFTYPRGEDIVRDFVFGGTDPIGRFARLLETPATPDQVLEWTEARTPGA
jgi:hypothetical protein